MMVIRARKRETAVFHQRVREIVTPPTEHPEIALFDADEIPIYQVVHVQRGRRGANRAPLMVASFFSPLGLPISRVEILSIPCIHGPALNP